MKKAIAVFALAFGISNGFAQDLTSKKGEPILPEAGDWAIGVEANPFLDYMGNFFGKSNDNSAPSFNFHNPIQVITGKYFKDAQMAYRAGLRIGFNNEAQRAMTTDRAAITNSAIVYPAPSPMTENVWKKSSTTIGLSAGIEKRRGKTRLQGYYGGEVGIFMTTSKDKFTYGNKLNPDITNPAAVYVNSGDAIASASNTAANPGIVGVDGNGARIIERKNGTVFGIGVRGFIGVEYFILPKISLGGEFGWGLGVSMQGKSSTTWESSGNIGTTLTAQTTEIEGAKQSDFSIDTDNNYAGWGPSGSLRINFHF